jgi:hypothetical protein
MLDEYADETCVERLLEQILESGDSFLRVCALLRTQSAERPVEMVITAELFASYDMVWKAGRSAAPVTNSSTGVQSPRGIHALSRPPQSRETRWIIPPG